MTDPVARWRRALREVADLPDAEIAARTAELVAFCAARRTEPADLLAHWDRHTELTVRRDRATDRRPHLVVESFLIHNGVNVFGDLVCVPATAEHLRQQRRDLG